MNNQNNNEDNNMGSINLGNLSSNPEEIEVLQPTMNISNQSIMAEATAQAQSVDVQNNTMVLGQAQDGNLSMNANVSDNNISNYTESYDDESLLEAFIGKNQEKILESSFNFAGLFFGQFYLFYRKMFAYGILVFLLNVIITNFLKMSFLTIFVNLAIGLIVNKIYINFAKKKINKIKVNNMHKSQGELAVICSKKGGTSIGQLFLGFFVEIVIALLIVIITIIFGLSTVFGGLVSSFSKLVLNSTLENNISNATYDGTLYYNADINITEKFTINVPIVFKESMFNDDYMFAYEYNSNQGVFDGCSVNLAALENFNSAEKLANQMYNYFSNSNPTSVLNTKINNINWYWLSYSDSMGTNYYYLTEKDNKVFLLEYKIEKNADSNCINYKDRIITSIIAK